LEPGTLAARAPQMPGGREKLPALFRVDDVIVGRNAHAVALVFMMFVQRGACNQAKTTEGFHTGTPS
jgi:hypothetical protein